MQRTFPKEYEKLQSNNYRILSEAYKDVQALRTIEFLQKKKSEILFQVEELFLKKMLTI